MRSPLTIGPPRSTFVLILANVLTLACSRPGESAPGQEPEVAGDGGESVAATVLQREMERIDAAAEAVDAVFQPLPLLTPGEEQSLRQHSNARQLARARELGVDRGLPGDRLRALEEEGRLVRLNDSEHWVLRGLDYSQPLTVPAVRDLLTEIGERFQSRLLELEAPPFRVEVSSVFRTVEDQESLRRVNPNAALGESTHEYGASVDLPYSAFAAPAEPMVAIDTAGAPWLAWYLERYAAVAAERIAARRALELKAILGQVLLEMQREGMVMVTLERQQPVFHLTLARQ